ncbi:MAG: 2Fe-2S iron-sulfur cluster-binding protein [Alphaproteobacteria bacterium]
MIAFDCPSHIDVLTAAIRAGIDLPSLCRSGTCGACAVRLVAGQVEAASADEFAWSPADRRERLILACQSMPAGDEIVLDYGSGVAVQRAAGTG